MKKIPVALQMYTVRDEMEKDFLGTLGKVSKMGYDGVELAGFGGLSAKELKLELQNLGLQAVSSHTPIELMEQSIDRIIEDHTVLGCHFVAIPWLAESRRPGTPGFDSLITSISSIGKSFKDHHIQLCYHNHDFEFKTLNGKFYLDILYERVDPSLLMAEIDTYWVKYAGIDPAAYIRKYPGRCPLIHLKDMEDSPERAFAEVGNGTQNLPAIFAASEEVGSVWYIVEQDSCKRPTLESAKISIDNLRRMGL